MDFHLLLGLTLVTDSRYTDMLHRRCIMSCRSQFNINIFQKYSREGISCQGNPVVRLNDAEVQCHPQQV